MAQKIKIIVTLLSLVTLSCVFIPAIVSAQPCASEQSEGCGDNSSSTATQTPTSDGTTTDACGNTEDSNGQVSNSAVQSCLTQSPIVHDINTIVDFLSAGVGVIVTGVIILGGIQYSLAGDNPQAIGAAKQRIVNGLIALAAFFLIFAFLQWIIPGGVFS